MQVTLMKSDGNGGYVIHKGVFTLIMTVIALLSCVGTVIAYTVTIRSDVNYLKTEYAMAGPRNIEIIDGLKDNIEQNQKTIIQNQERIIAMQDDLKEIKSDVKEIIRK